ncbi:winged helix-turn-helix domain-containing protein [Mycobacterium sp. AMU20-3851]|uniref:winged helix-turn-helix domain-containing protein n=1 Tax=Mycobacterium sp. AMU20-3851 TaxID=3122055 RepID=UPI003753FD0A
MYQAGLPRATDSAPAVQVVLVFDVPAGFTELPARTAQLADEFGRVIADTVPGVRVRPAVITAARHAATPDRVPVAEPFDGLLIDRAGREVRAGGAPVRLSYLEFELLCFLADHQHQPVSRAQLMREVWAGTAGADDADLSGRTVDTHIRRLRVKLGAYAVVITTIRGRGYRFDPGPGVRYLPAAADRRHA